MSSVRRALRMLTAGGLIPLVLAAGLPLRTCACDAGAPPEATSCCCGKAGSECGDAKEGGCPCCKAAARRAGNSPAKSKDTSDSSKPGPSLGCRCGGANSTPAAPAAPGFVSVIDAGLPSAPPSVVPPPMAATASAERLRSARLPVADLTTAFCALVI